MSNNFENLNNLLNEINELKQAKELLDDIWLELGPYNRDLSIELRIKLENFYDFDDSE